MSQRFYWLPWPQPERRRDIYCNAPMSPSSSSSLTPDGFFSASVFLLFFSFLLPPFWSFPMLFPHPKPRYHSSPSIPLSVHSRCYQEGNDSSGGQWSDPRRRIIVTPGFYAEAIFLLITALSVESEWGKEERIKTALIVCRKSECTREGCGEGD